MKNSAKRTYYFTLLTSATVYLLAYLACTPQYSHVGAAISFTVGLAVYLIIRKYYRADTNVNQHSAKAYRIIIWLVPICLFAGRFVLLYLSPEPAPSFTTFYTLDDLVWSGALVVALLPLLNIFVLLDNAVILVMMLIYHFGGYVLVGLFVLCATLMVSTVKQLINLKRQSIVKFSLRLAVINTITPVILYSYCAYLWL